MRTITKTILDHRNTVLRSFAGRKDAALELLDAPPKVQRTVKSATISPVEDVASDEAAVGPERAPAAVESSLETIALELDESAELVKVVRGKTEQPSGAGSDAPATQEDCSSDPLANATSITPEPVDTQVPVDSDVLDQRETEFTAEEIPLIPIPPANVDFPKITSTRRRG